MSLLRIALILVLLLLLTALITVFGGSDHDSGDSANAVAPPRVFHVRTPEPFRTALAEIPEDISHM
jgi:hypothetical protein